MNIKKQERKAELVRKATKRSSSPLKEKTGSGEIEALVQEKIQTQPSKKSTNTRSSRQHSFLADGL
jgi:hypothetical protein